MQMNGKVVLITGANGGLGSAVTEAFLKSGARVAGVSRSIKDPEPPNPNFMTVRAELADSNAARALVDTISSKWGGVNTLVHLVGGFAGGQSVADSDDAMLEKMLDMNFRSAFHIVRAVLPNMRNTGSGSILAIGSRTAVEPQPMLGVYSASKSALVSLIRTVALENKDRNISANVILPGTIDTPANRAANPAADFMKWVQPSQIASLLVHLASGDASQVTGAVIPVYGGDL
jgi:NAD(P)-dependent dehydrogenase (short-subunit alcohol dehydrogenase family)